MEIAGFLTRLPTYVPLSASQYSSEMCRERSNESILNVGWTYPLNAIVNLTAIAIQPLLTLISLVAAAVFKLISAFSSEENAKTADIAMKCNLEAAQLSVPGIAVMFVRIFYPSFMYDTVNEW